MRIWGTGILNGLRIVMRNMRRGPITVQYPRERVELPERARWAVTMNFDEEGNHKCTACMACERACPDFIIKIDVTTDEARNKHIDSWGYELGACMMCGLCVEACPFDAIRMGHDYELATTDPNDLKTRLLHDTPAAKPKRAERPERPAGAGAARPKPAAEPPATADVSAEHSHTGDAPHAHAKPSTHAVQVADADLAITDDMPTIAPSLAEQADMTNPAAEAAEAPVHPAPEASTTLTEEAGPTSMETVEADETAGDPTEEGIG